ncbi:uncharacterized protein F4807DRAFT_178629 [Annulohypoxylon truncatum]|uniref:uncharacterized protein n=1 Tax=Annulohypoxylon truncatum TaxID=327061 RepID=UPI0020089C71|nr:uncharacterized protein F4807DRAFT_178629 [Annulohypoxylon truncatum]KAI1207453.1 hypothetical protein F4807DRAFT_178629 [Annulohypoxylon truncatum]
MASHSSIGRPGGSAGSSSNASHHYDPQTGQTYREFTSKLQSLPRNIGWEREGVLESEEGSFISKTKGARSFIDMLVTVVARNTHLLEFHHLEPVPPHILLLIWVEMVNDYKRMPLHSFMILSGLLSYHQRTSEGKWDLPKDVYKFHQTLKLAGSPFSNFTKPLMSKPFDFIVHLTLAGNEVCFENHELLSLTKLKNLGVLEIVQPRPLQDASNFPRVNDSVLRQWAITKDAFPLLRVLRIWGDYFTTRRTLSYLDRFPSLRVYDVAGLKNDWRDAAAGPSWKMMSYQWGWTLLESISEIIESLSTSSIYGDTSKAYSLMAYWDSGVDNDLLRELELFSAVVERIVDDEEAARLRESILPDKYQTYDFNYYLKQGKAGDRTGRWVWGYMLYCHIGRLTGNKDLVEQGMHDPRESFVIDDNLIPPRPYIELNIGDFEDTDKRGKFQSHCTFTRAIEQPSKKRPASPADPTPSPAPKKPSHPGPPRKLTKKQRFFDLSDL